MPHLSGTIRVWQSIEGQDPDRFAEAMIDGCNTVGSHILGLPHKLRSPETVTTFVSGKWPLTTGTDNGNLVIAPTVFSRQGFVTVALALHLICNAKTFQFVAGLLRTVSRIRVKSSLIAQQKRIVRDALMHIARSNWLVSKSTKAHETLSSVVKLDDKDRIGEIARMLAGGTVTDVARVAARVLLNPS